jgi:hypothetical protein
VKRAVALLAFLTLALAVPSASGAEFEIVPGSFAVHVLDAEGNPESRAGSHPDLLRVDFALHAEGTSPRDLEFEMPPGLGGFPGAVPECPRELFDADEECPAESQVGTFVFGLSGGGQTTLPIFQLEPAPGEIIAFGTSPGFDAALAMRLRPDDFGITFEVHDLPEAALSEGQIELWGVPADRQVGTEIPRRPLLTLPSACGPLVFGFRTRSWEEGAPWLSASAEAESPLVGCNGLAFGPRLAVGLGNPRADSPTGARIDLRMEEGDDPDGLANAQMKDATIALPEGLTVSPGGIAGSAACSDAQLGLGSEDPVSCPPSSRVGAVEIVSPELPEPLVGDLYLGQERPGERLRLFIAATTPGVVAKFVGTMRADPTTGRLSADLEDLPQLPLSRLTLSIDGGSRALLASPLTCGSFPAAASFESYGGGPPASSSAAVAVVAGTDGSPCANPPPFSPGLFTASSSPAAGRPTTVSMTLRRRAGEQLTRRFSVSLPKGLNASFAGIDSCPDSAAAAASCPAGSRVGDAIAEVGSGASPATLHGEVYAAGPYHRAPFSLVMVLHAAIGPFDLGATAIRMPVSIDSRSGRVTVATDPLPALIEGIPARIQGITMNLDRRGMVRNPTSCAPASFDGSLEAASGARAAVTSSLAVKGCNRLGFRPRFSISLTDRAQLRKRGHPSLRVSARLRKADANLEAMHITLPGALKFDISGLGEVCPRRDATDDLCSPRARVGRALVRSPLLDKPMRGSVYVVQPRDGGLPDLWIGVSALGMHLDIRGTTSTRDGHLVTNLVGLPDMPLSTFSMQLGGGGRGVLSLRSDPCARGDDSGLVSSLSAKGQDGDRRRIRLKAGVRCGRAAATGPRG